MALLTPTSYLLPPTAYRLLPTAYCLLPTAYCLHIVLATVALRYVAHHFSSLASSEAFGRVPGKVIGRRCTQTIHMHILGACMHHARAYVHMLSYICIRHTHMQVLGKLLRSDALDTESEEHTLLSLRPWLTSTQRTADEVMATLHLTSCTLHPTSCNPHPTPYSLHGGRSAGCPALWSPTSYLLPPTSHLLPPASYLLRHTYYLLFHTSCNLSSQNL